MRRLFLPLVAVLFVAVLSTLVPVSQAQVAIVTRSVDNRRSGANTHETSLKPSNVSQVKFLRELKTDGDDDPRIEAQPLYVPKVQTDNGRHDLVIVCTMGNNVYAFDAETGSRIWKTGNPLGPAVKPNPKGGRAQTGLQPTDIDIFGINQRWGILSTPVIDAETNTLYVVDWSSPDGTTDSASFHLNALRLRDGKPAKPAIAITAESGGARFDPHLQKQRSALLLVRTPGAGGAIRKTLFMACGLTHETAQNHHGWLLAFDVGGDTMRRVAAFCTTPTSEGGGIWQAGQGPSADAEGFIYVMTANGGWNGTTDFSESFLKLRFTPPASATGEGTLTVVDWFTPFRDKDRGKPTGNAPDFRDEDLGSAGPVLSTGSLVAGAGKDGVLYVMERHNLGKKVIDPAKPQAALYPQLKSALFYTYFPGFQLNPLDINDLDTLPTGHTHHLHGSSVIWDSQAHGTMLFVWGENSPLRAWSLDGNGVVKFLAQSNETASAFSTRPDAMPGGMLTLSANGDRDGIIWGITPVKGNWQGHDNDGDANKEMVEGVLRAYDAASFGPPLAGGDTSLKLLWQSTTPGNPKAGEARFTFDKFCPPVVANGRVLVTTYDGRVLIYGL